MSHFAFGQCIGPQDVAGAPFLILLAAGSDAIPRNRPGIKRSK